MKFMNGWTRLSILPRELASSKEQCCDAKTTKNKNKKPQLKQKRA